MAIIYSFPRDINILGTDILLGTTTVLVGGKPKNQTRSFEMDDISSFVIGNIPRGTLTSSDDINIKLDLGGDPLSALFKDVSANITWSGTLADDRITSAENWNSKQPGLNGVGFVKINGTTISYDNSTYALFSQAVPYINATQNVNLGEWQLMAGQVAFDLTPTGTNGVGILRWNDSDGTLDLRLKGNSVTLQIGQEQVKRVVNKTGGALLEANYQVVRSRLTSEGGASGQRLAVVLAQADSDLHSATTIGVVTETINNNQEGFINISGEIHDINTTGSLQGETWADGDLLYLSSTIAGRLTNIKPIAPQHLVTIGQVVYAHAVNGKIDISIQNGYELEELHNVLITAVANNNGLFYDSATSLWKNKTIASALGYTPADDANVVHKTGTDIVYGLKIFNDQIYVDALEIGNVTGVDISTGSFFTNIKSVVTTASRTLLYPDKDGTFAVTSDIPAPLGYTPENVANKSNSYTASSVITYASTKALVDGLSFKANLTNPTFTDDINVLGNVATEGSVFALSFVKTGGSSSEFLKADGSIDSNTYALDSNVVHKTGDETITGIKTFYDAINQRSIIINGTSFEAYDAINDNYTIIDGNHIDAININASGVDATFLTTTDTFTIYEVGFGTSINMFVSTGTLFVNSLDTAFLGRITTSDGIYTDGRVLINAVDNGIDNLQVSGDSYFNGSLKLNNSLISEVFIPGPDNYELSLTNSANAIRIGDVSNGTLGWLLVRDLSVIINNSLFIENNSGPGYIYADNISPNYNSELTIGSNIIVNGSVQVNNDTNAATSDKVGAIRYRSDANNSYMDMVMQTGASTYAWVNIVQNSW